MTNNIFFKFSCVIIFISTGSLFVLATDPNPNNDCFQTSKSVPINCKLINANNWTCIKPHVISVPQTVENSNFSINCTASFPIDVNVEGIQLHDSYKTFFVRNAENIYNEATFVYSIAILTGSLTAPRRFTVERFSDNKIFLSFYMLRPGKKSFDENVLFSSEKRNVIVVNRLSQTVVIPCVVNDVKIKPTLMKQQEDGSAGEEKDVTANYLYDYTMGFLVGGTDTTGLYVCRANHSSEQVKVEILAAEEFVAEPRIKDLIFFTGDEIRVSCLHNTTPVVLIGNIIKEGSKRRVQTSTTLPASNQLGYKSEFHEKDLVEGDSGNIECVNLDDNTKVFHSWSFKTLDVTRNPTLNLTLIDKNTMSCQSSFPNPKISTLFCQGISHCKLQYKCLQQKLKNCPNIKEGTPCTHNAGSCLTFPLEKEYTQGMIICSAGDYTYETNYIRGFDGILYPNWELAPLDALIDVKLPQGKLYPQKSYPFGCQASKFISDGKLQWVIRGKDGSEILLHKGRVQDLYGTFGLNYDLYTVRESNIRLIYPNDYDILCLAPQWNGTASIRNFKRISVEEKPTKVKEISIGSGIAIFFLVVPLIYVIWRLKKAKEALRNLTEDEVDEFLKGNPEILKSLQGKEAHEIVDSLPYNPDFEIPRDKLLIDVDNVLGSGAFGTVLKGKLEGRDECVAVKTVKSKCEIDHFKGFLSELKIMMYIGTHPNIVTLIGAYTEKIREKTLFIVVELCTMGSMESYLRTTRSQFFNQIQNDEILIDTNLSPLLYQNVSNHLPGSYENTLKTIDLIVWSYQVANGMAYLASKKVVHADLAARNVLIHGNGTAKITDFGLSRQLFDYGMYVKKQQEPLPWRWMAIESLQRMAFSSKSDVWSYGVLLWEIFSLGDVPYPGRSWTISFVEELCNGLRMIRPTFATNSIYNIMFDCWKEDPNQRPTFQVIKEYFRTMMISLGVDVESIDTASTSQSFVKMEIGQDSFSGDGKSSRQTNIYL